MELEALKRNRDLVSIARPSIDPNMVRGFILHYSQDLLVLHYEYDFILDGLMIVRRKDIKSIYSSDTDRFHTEILKRDDLFKNVNFDIQSFASDWPSLLAHLRSQYKFITVESEKRESPMFVLGVITKLGKRAVRIHGIDGIGAWIDEETTIPYGKITSVRVGTNYISAYERNVQIEP